MYTIYADGQLLYSSITQETHAILAPGCRLDIGGAGSLDFTILPTHYLYNSLHKMKTIITAFMEGNPNPIFTGRILNTQVDIYKQKQVRCEGNLSYLLDTIMPPYEGLLTVSAFFSTCVAQHNSQVEAAKQFTVGTVNIDEALVEVYFKNDSYSDTKSIFESELINIYGGYFRTRTVGGITYLDYIKNYGHTSSQAIQLGSNIIDLSESISADSIFTVLLPLGDSFDVVGSVPARTEILTVASVNGGNKFVENAVGIAAYGRIVHTESFDGVVDPSVLLAKANAYMATNYKPAALQLSIQAVDLRLFNATLDQFAIGHLYNVISSPHGLNVTLTCTSISYDFEDPGNTSLELSVPVQIKSTRATGLLDENGYVESGYQSGLDDYGGYTDQAGVPSIAEAMGDAYGGGTNKSGGGFKNQYKHIKETKDGLLLEAKRIELRAETILLQSKDYTDEQGNVLNAAILIEKGRITAAVSDIDINNLSLTAAITVERGRITANVTELNSMNDSLTGQIIVEKDRITAEVLRAINGEEVLSGRITVTATAINLEVLNRETQGTQLIGQINVQAGRITAEVARAEGAEVTLSGRLTITESNIALEVTNRTDLNNTLRGLINVEAGRITAEVTRASGAETTLSGRLTITESNIALEVTNRTNSANALSGRIDVEAGKITTEVTRASREEGLLAGRITVTEGNINLAVTKAGIITDINIAPGTVTINAGKLNVPGIITAGSIAVTGDISAVNAKFENLVAGISTAGTLRAGYIEATGNMGVGGSLNTGYLTVNTNANIAALSVAGTNIINALNGKASSGHTHDSNYLGIGYANNISNLETNVAGKLGTDATAADSHMLDGNHASAFAVSAHDHAGVYLLAGGTATNATKLNGQLASYYAIAHTHPYLASAGKAADSEKLDGIDSLGFAPATHTHTGVYLAAAGQAENSKLLDGIDSLGFALVGHSHVQSSKSVVTGVSLTKTTASVLTSTAGSTTTAVTSVTLTTTTSTIYYYDPV